MNRKSTIRFFFCVIFIYSAVFLYAQNVFINEVMSSNSFTIADEDGDYPDWIELYNDGTIPINLANYGLSDRENEPFKWIFPNVLIEPKEHLLIFASEKDRRTLVSHWETVIDRGDNWKYHNGDASIPSNWNTVHYNDSDWLSGSSGFGYGDGDDATVVSNAISLYIRKVFNVDDVNNIPTALLHIDYDDAFIAYLNGVEIARSNIGVPGNSSSFNQTANSAREAEMYSGGFPEKYDVDSIPLLLQEGNNVLAIQVHNVSSTSSDLTLIPFFTLGMLEPPVNPTDFPEILQLQQSVLHTNFKISSRGESLILNDQSGTTVDKVDLENIPIDVSWGRQPDGSSNWFLFYNPTPGTSNDNQGYLEIAKEPQFSKSGGFYTGAVDLSLSATSPSETIHYTLDGSEPDESSNVYTEPISITSTTVVRARAFDSNVLPSKTVTHTYFINSEHTLPVFSLSTTPENFFDVDQGIYTLGNSYQSSNPYYGANFWQDWECPIHVEFFEPNGILGFSMDAGVKIIGGWSRANPQKAMAIFARNKYGYGAINYQLFPDRPFDEFQAVVLRNGGNDWARTFFSDGLMHSLVEDIDLEIMAFRPCAVYINGEYWGFLNLREKQNEHYIAMHHGVNPDSIDLLEFDRNPIHGDAQHYNMLMDYVSNNDMSQAENYEYAKTLMDMDNYISYNVVQIYFDNRDWPSNNIKYWRPKTENGKWRWILFDTDWGFGVNAYGNGGNQYAYDYNTLEFATSPQQTPNHHANPPWSTYLLRTLLENEDFKNSFINRFADYFNTVFQPDVVVEKIYEIQDIIEPEIQEHLDKWSRSYPLWSRHNLWWNDMDTWYNYIEIMVDFADNRIPHMRNHIIDKFDLSGYSRITLNISPPAGGLIQISTIISEQYPWRGYYFRDTPIPVKAIPHSGYIFSRWTGHNSTDSDSITVELTSGIASLTAEFEQKTEGSEFVVINEINYNSNSNFNPGDWIEIVNISEASIDISGWQLKDSDDDNVFYIPENSVLDSQKYFVVCSDTLLFKSVFPTVNNIIGNLGFGLNRTGESVRLYNESNVIIDSLIFDNRYPWPMMPDGGGPTLELKNPNMDNSLAANWMASDDYGTPGSKNTTYVELSINPVPILPMTFKLHPNYPNPFNAITTISYELEEPSHVNFSMYNVFGQLVDVLINEHVRAGEHSVSWNACSFSSGVYFFKISAGKNTAVGKCLFLK